MKNKWYKNEIQPVMKKDELTVLWDSPVHTERSIQSNKLDIAVKDVKKRKCTLIDISLTSDTNTVSKKLEKICKYRDLQTEISRC